MHDTLPEILLHSLKSYQKDTLMLYKQGSDYVPLSSRDFANRIKRLSLALQDMGVQPGDKIILLAENGPQWTMTDLSILCIGGVTVPVYTTLIPEHIKYIINDSDAQIVFCSDQALWDKVKEVRPDLKNVKHYITFYKNDDSGIFSLPQLLELGKEIEHNHPDRFEKTALQVQPADLASIIYTSGTTGTPKGVILTHSNFTSNVKTVSGLLDLRETDTVFSFLPLSHVFERTVTFGYLYNGCTIGYAGSTETIADDIYKIKPHVFASVPRLFEKIYAKIMDGVLTGSALKRKIFYGAIKTGKTYSQKKLTNRPISLFLRSKRFIADRLVFSKITDRIGGRVRFCVSAAAPLAKDIAEFFHAVGLVILEGYGLTETSPCNTMNTMESLKFGTVGKPIPGVKIRIAEDGEILTQGPNVMKGYYKNLDWTNDVLKNDWFYTGDIGFFDADGFLVITDRKKDIIITSGGKNTAPQPTENMLRMSPYISNAVVIGDRRKFLSALIVPDFDKIKEYARNNNISYTGLKDLVKNSLIVKFIETELEKYTSKLSAFEKIKKLALLDRDFEIEKNEITPTLKIKRKIIAQNFSTLIESLYAE